MKFEEITPTFKTGDQLERLRNYLANDRHFSPHNVYTITKTAGTILRRYPDTPPGQELADRIADDLRANNRSESTVRSYLFVVQYLAASQGVTLKIQKPRPAERMPLALTSDEARRLLASCRTYHEHAIISVFLWTGLRATELLNLDLEDADLKGRRLFLRARGQCHLKNNREDVSIMSEECTRSVAAWLARRPVVDDQALFISEHGRRYTLHGIEALVYRVAKRAGLRVHPHKLRRTCFTQMASCGVSTPVIQRQSHHRDLRSLDPYLRVTDDALRENIDGKFRY
jgi:integrase